MAVLAKIRALSNETRLEIVKLVRGREMSAGSLATRFELTRPAVSQHLSVLRKAGLLDERRVGSRRLYIVRARGFDELVEFIEGFWAPRLSHLKRAAEAAERGRSKR